MQCATGILGRLRSVRNHDKGLAVITIEFYS